MICLTIGFILLRLEKRYARVGMILMKSCMRMTIGRIRGKMSLIWSVKWKRWERSNIRLYGITFSKETGDTHWITSCVCVKTWRDPLKNIRRLKRKIRLQASEHAQDIEKYKAMIEDLKYYARDIMNLYFIRLYIILTNRQGWKIVVVDLLFKLG